MRIIFIPINRSFKFITQLFCQFCIIFSWESKYLNKTIWVFYTDLCISTTWDIMQSIVQFNSRWVLQFLLYLVISKNYSNFFVTVIFVFVTFPSAPSTSVTPVMFDLYLNAVEVFFSCVKKNIVYMSCTFYKWCTVFKCYWNSSFITWSDISPVTRI